MRPDDGGNDLAGQPEILGYQGGAIGRENPVRQFQVEQPVPDAWRYGTRPVDEELALRLVV